MAIQKRFHLSVYVHKTTVSIQDKNDVGHFSKSTLYRRSESMSPPFHALAAFQLPLQARRFLLNLSRQLIRMDDHFAGERMNQKCYP